MDLPSMFEQARSLVAGAKIIINSEGILDGGGVYYPTTPVIVSCALAIEIGLKLIIQAQVGKRPKDHDLESLFNQLPGDIREAFIAHYLSQNPDETEVSLLKKISQHKGIFVDWRYAYESSKILECSPSFLYQLAYALSTYTEQSYKFKRNDNGWLKGRICVKHQAQN